MTLLQPVKDRFALDKSEWFAFALFSLCMALYLGLAIQLMGGPDFNDETEKYITAKLLIRGGRLYSDVFVQHGPVAYMLSHLFHLVFGFQGMEAPRAIPIGLSLLAIASVMLSPVLVSRHARFIAGAIMAIGLAATQAHFAMVQTMYQVYAGYFYLIAAAFFLIPFMMGTLPKRWHAITAGICLALIFFCAFSFAVSIFFFCAACSLRLWFSTSPTDRQDIIKLLGYIALGALIGTGIVATWLYAYGDGVGYVISHFYFNLKYYVCYLAKECKFSPYAGFITWIPGWVIYLYSKFTLLPGHSVWFTYILMAMPCIYTIFLCIAARTSAVLGKRMFPYLILGVLVSCSIVFMNPRGSVSFQTSSTVIIVCGLCAIIGSALIGSNGYNLPVVRKIHEGLLTGLFIACGIAQGTAVTWLYQLLPIDYYHQKGTLGAEKSREMDFVRSFVEPADGILSLPFSLADYTRMDRAPAFGIFYWMPWQNDYAKNPVPGYPFNLCQDIEKNPPKAMFYTDFPIWDNPADTFSGCIKTALRKHYVRSISVAHLWVRADVVASRSDVLASSLIPSDFDITSHSIPAQSLFAKAKTRMGQLETDAKKSCLTVPLIPHSDNREGILISHDPVTASHCNAPQAIQLGLQKKGDGVRIVAMSDIFSKDIQCLEVTGALTTDGAPTRFWPCMDVHNQTFARMRGKRGDKLRAHHSNLCLAARDGHVIQTDCATAPEWYVR